MSENRTEKTALETAHQEGAVIKLWQTMGAHKLANQIVASLGAQSIRALEMVRDEKLYVVAGHDTFDSFLDRHAESPMSYEAFRRRANLLNNEGDVAFDLLNSLNVPLSQRKLLAGQIEVSENQIKIGEASTRLDDGPRIVELISKLHLKTLEQQRTIDRGKKDVDKYKRQADDAKKQAVMANPDGTETGQALLTAAGALHRLREVLGEASDEEKLALRGPVFEMLRVNQLECSVALGIINRASLASEPSNGDDLDLTDEQAAELLGED